MAQFKLKLKRIDPVKYATIAALLTALIMLVVFVPVFLIFSTISAGLAKESMGPAAALFGGGIVMAVLFPLIYGVLTFIITLIATSLLNFILKKTGGLELDFEKTGLDVNRIDE